MESRFFFIIASASILLLCGCVQQQGNGNVEGEPVQLVEAGDTVSVEYKGTLQDGALFDSSEGRGPLSFTAGAGEMIRGFDAAVVGMRLNEEKTVTLQPAEAYPYDESRVVELPKSNFAEVETLRVGQEVVSENGPSGIVKEIKENTVVVDFNHPLAGKTLTFWIKVVGIEKK